MRTPRSASGGGPTGTGRRAVALLLALATLAVAEVAAAADEHAAARQRMVGEIEATQREVAGETGRARFGRRVLRVLAEVPRHEFVRPRDCGEAYENRPLPIGHGQTISQPYIVALMTDLLEQKPGGRVFELGTGSGYQAAILAKLVREVYTVEIVAALGRRAGDLLLRLGYGNVQVKVADGY